MKSIITTEVFDFLKSLEQNNEREWFNQQKKSFKNVEKQVKDFCAEVFELLSQHDKLDSFKLFRIYRDVRFSKNKAPYKTHFGCSFKREQPGLRGGYYIHIQPSKSFIAVGFWEPNSADLKRIRQELDYEASEFRRILSHNKLSSVWGSLKGEQLKTAPRDFPKDHPDMDLIKFKQFLLIKEFTDEQVKKSSFGADISESIKVARPFLNWMSHALTTNLDGESIL